MSKQISISIDLTGLRDEFNLLQSQVDGLGNVIVTAITDRLFYNWQTEAMNGLKSTRKQYLDGLNIGEVSSTHKYIQLTEMLPNMLESGFGAFDIKPGELKSPNAKTTKKGIKFITIPFRWGTSGSIGESDVFANVMPKEINDIVKDFKGTTTSISGTKSTGENLGFNQIPKQYQIPKTRAAFSDIQSKTTYPEYTHKGPLTEGMVRNEKTYESTTKGSYTTFRRISENSDINSWIHQGVSAKNFADKAINNTSVDVITDQLIYSFLQQNGF
jgi:hypothetical protein